MSAKGYSESEVRNGLHMWLVGEVQIEPHKTLPTVNKILEFIEAEHDTGSGDSVPGVETGTAGRP